MPQRTKKLLAAMGLLLLGAAIEYTVGGGWKVAKQALTPTSIASGGHGMMQPFELPAPMGPKDAKVKVDIFVNTRNGCHRPMVAHQAETLKPYADRVRVVFRDINSAEAGKMLAGYPRGCELITLLNGLMAFKVPWRKEPVMLEGPVGKGPMSVDYGRLFKWAVSPEGQKSLAAQRKAFEVERQKRLKKEKELAAKGAATPKGSPPGPPGTQQPSPAPAGSAPGAAAPSAAAPAQPH